MVMKPGFQVIHQHMKIFHHPNIPSALNNRKDDYGGVLLAITNTLTTSDVLELDTDCESIKKITTYL